MSVIIAYIFGFGITWAVLSLVVPWFDNHPKCDICGIRSDSTRKYYIDDDCVLKFCRNCEEEGKKRIDDYNVTQIMRFVMKDMYDNPNRYTFYTTFGDYPDWMTDEDKYKLRRLQLMTEEQRQQVKRSQSRDVNIRTCRL